MVNDFFCVFLTEKITFFHFFAIFFTFWVFFAVFRVLSEPFALADGQKV